MTITPSAAMLQDSQQHWLGNVKAKLDPVRVTLGPLVSQAYKNDPRMVGFIAARYKFAAKMLDDCMSAIEAGCGDGFGAPIVAQSVRNLICTDIDFDQMEDNTRRLRGVHNIDFRFHDFCKMGRLEPVEAIYLIDVIEHIFPNEEEAFLYNLCKSLDDDGILLIGTPNTSAQQYASKHSVEGHVNLKSHDELKRMLQRRFRHVFMFGMNDEVVHTGFLPMAHYLWAMGVGQR